MLSKMSGYCRMCPEYTCLLTHKMIKIAVRNFLMSGICTNKNLKTENVRKDFKQPDKLRTIKFEYRKCPDRFLYNSNNRINSGQLKNSGQISDSLSKKG